jgi:hypothetical protein
MGKSFFLTVSETNTMATPAIDIALFVRDRIGARHDLTADEVRLWQGLVDSMKSSPAPEHVVQFLALLTVAGERAAGREELAVLLKHLNALLVWAQRSPLTNESFRDLLEIAKNRGLVETSDWTDSQNADDPEPGVHDMIPEEVCIRDVSLLPNAVRGLYLTATTKAIDAAKAHDDAIMDAFWPGEAAQTPLTTIDAGNQNRESAPPANPLPSGRVVSVRPLTTTNLTNEEDEANPKPIPKWNWPREKRVALSTVKAYLKEKFHIPPKTTSNWFKNCTETDKVTAKACVMRANFIFVIARNYSTYTPRKRS